MFPVKLILPCLLCKWSSTGADHLPGDHYCTYVKKWGRIQKGCTKCLAILSPAHSQFPDTVQKYLPLNDFCLNCLLGWE